MPSDHPYTPFFCEENIWHLAARMLSEGVAAGCLSVLVLSNDRRQIPLFAQRAGRRQDGLVVWDYHVVLHRAGEGGQIFDLDTRLPCPCPSAQYWASTLPDEGQLPPELRILIRVVPAASWVRHFSSDRSHMLDAQGRPSRPFPPWGAIIPAERGQRIDLADYLDMRLALPDGSRVGTQEQLAGLLAQ